MEKDGEAADDQGSGWLEVKKVFFLFCSLMIVLPCLTPVESVT